MPRKRRLIRASPRTLWRLKASLPRTKSVAFFRRLSGNSGSLASSSARANALTIPPSRNHSHESWLQRRHSKELSRLRASRTCSASRRDRYHRCPCVPKHLRVRGDPGSCSVRLRTLPTTDDEERALEVLLSLREGEFAVYPEAPRTCRFARHRHDAPWLACSASPRRLDALLRERGLTGRLLLELRGRLAIGYYEKGELSDVSIDGGTAADFVLALEWTEGTFRVDAMPPPP